MAERSARSRPGKWILTAGAVVIVGVLLLYRGFEAARSAAAQTSTDPSPSAAAREQYQCSMHPQIVSDHPGTCPICGMQLQRVSASEADLAARRAPSRRVLFYRHPMRADVTSPVPAKDEMGMDYVAVYEDEASPPAGAGPGAGPPVAGHAGFTLSPERQQLIGVKTGLVERRQLEARVRAAGRVAYDPKLYQAIIEYREALRSRAAVADSSSREAHAGAEGIVRSAALKLRQQGFSEAQVRAISPSTGDPTNLLLGGSSAWVYAQVYEFELGRVAVGQVMEISLPSAPRQRFTARVAAIDPVLDPITRTARIRALVADSTGLLRPESYVDVEILVPLGERLAVSREAILESGERPLAFVVDERGRFEPRAVELGVEADGYREVVAGLAAGERVVTSANFLIDSESRFRAAVDAYRPATPRAQPNAAPTAPAAPR